MVEGFSSFYTIPERRKKGLEKLEEFPETTLLGTTSFREFPKTRSRLQLDLDVDWIGILRFKNWRIETVGAPKHAAGR